MTDAGAVLFSANPCPAPPDKCPGAKHYISCLNASAFVNNPPIEPINASSEWFEKGLITFLISQIPANGGIRFYFGKHTNIVDDTIPRHGVIMMVTDSNHKDMFICVPNTAKFRYPFVDGGGADNGEECPTNCQGSQIP